MDFSIIIPGYNAGKTLGWCLDGATDQDYAGDVEVLVVESGNGDHLSELARKFPGVRFIHAPFQLFSGQARNVAAGHASGETLVFLDADCRPVRGWLSELAAGHARGYGVISGAIENGNPESYIATSEYLTSHSSYSQLIPEHVLDETTAASGNMSVRRDVYDAGGGFAGTRRAEDFVFSGRLHDSGVKILFCPRAVVHHINPSKLSEYMGGQVARGWWNAMARIELGLKGSITERFPLLAFALFFLRLERLVVRCLRFRILPTRELVKALPLCALGIAAWTWGYFRASLENNWKWTESEILPLGWEQFEIIGAVPEDAKGGGKS